MHPRARQVDIISSLSEMMTTTTTSEPTISRNAIPFPLCESRWEEDRSQWQREELGSREYLAFVESRLLGVNSSHSPNFSAELRKKSNQESQCYPRPLASRCRSEARMRRGGGGGRSPFLPFCQKCRGGASKSAIDEKFDLLRPWNARSPFTIALLENFLGRAGAGPGSLLKFSSKMAGLVSCAEITRQDWNRQLPLALASNILQKRYNTKHGFFLTSDSR